MDYYDGNTVTALWNYAQSFAMSDNSYSTTFGPSTPGAINLVSGQTHGATPSASTSGGKAVCASTHTNVGGHSQKDYSAHHEPFEYYSSTSNPHHLAPASLAEVGRDGQANHQYDLSWFYRAVDAGSLPAVSFVKAARYQDRC